MPVVLQLTFWQIINNWRLLFDVTLPLRHYVTPPPGEWRRFYIKFTLY